MHGSVVLIKYFNNTGLSHQAVASGTKVVLHEVLLSLSITSSTSCRTILTLKLASILCGCLEVVILTLMSPHVHISCMIIFILCIS